MDPVGIINQYYTSGSRTYKILVGHGEAVSKKAVEIAEHVRHLNPDVAFIKEAAILHDIGIFMTDTPELECKGRHPYICHGFLGSQILNEMGLPRHARVCENHVGVGISLEDIIQNRLPLPERDMVPETLEEQIICYADKFFSKDPAGLTDEKPVEHILQGLESYGRDKVSRFLTWMEQFECCSQI